MEFENSKQHKVYFFTAIFFIGVIPGSLLLRLNLVPRFPLGKKMGWEKGLVPPAPFHDPLSSVQIKSVETFSKTTTTKN